MKQAKYLQDLKDHVDARSGENPGDFFNEIVAGILLPRLKGDPSFVANVEHKNRITCLEILERTPRSDHMRQFLSDILQTLIGLLERDTEEAATVALRILVELHRSGQEAEASSFLEVVKKAHLRLPGNVASMFTAKPGGPANTGMGAANAAGADATKKEGANDPKPRADTSMKLLTETPTSVLLILKSHPHLFNLTDWTQLMMGTLRVVPPDNAISANRSLYSDLILAQTKTFSLLCTFLSMVLMKKDDNGGKLAEVTNALPDLKYLPQSIVRLLKNCPPESISTRKDILFALRSLITAQNTFVSYQSSAHAAAQAQPSYAAPAIQNPGWGELWGNLLEQMDELTNERTLIGPGRTAHETLRPTAWSIAAEYVNQSRNKLTTAQLVNLVGIFGKHVHDPALPTNSVTFSMRLLSKLAEVIAQPDAPESTKRAQLLTKILDIFVNKLATLKRQIPDLLLAAAKASQKDSKESKDTNAAAAKEKEDAKKSSDDEDNSAMLVDSTGESSSPPSTTVKKPAFTMEPFVDEETDEARVEAEQAKWLATLDSVKESALAKDDPPSPTQQLTEMRQLVNVTINVIKTAVIQLQTHHGSHRPTKSTLVEEIYILNRFLRNVTHCLSVYDAPKLVEKPKEGSGEETSLEAEKPAAPSNGSHTSPTKGILQPNATCAPNVSDAFEKDCNAVSNILLNLDTNTLEDLLTTNLPYIYNIILEFPFLHAVLQSLMNTNLPVGANNAPSRPHVRTLNDLLLQFLITKIPVLTTADNVEATILQRLFKALFQTIGRQADDPPMSPTWAPILSGVVTQVLRLATETKDPLNLFHLLRYLFRNITKHEIWSKELAHQLPTIIDTINRIQENTSSQPLKDLLIELPLTLPVRVSAMLPCFKLFMKPLLAALEAPESEGYIYQSKIIWSLRFLEGYLGQFSTEFFEPLIAEHKARLLRALWRHMRQPPATFTSQVMRILGKMGGRIRPYAISSLPINTDDASTLTLSLSFDMPVAKQEPTDGEATTSSMDADSASGTTSVPAAEQINVPLIVADPNVKNVPRIIDLPLHEAILSARRILFLSAPTMLPNAPAASNASVSPQLAARKTSAFNFLKGCLFALLRPYADSPAPTKSLLLHNVGSKSGQFSTDEAATVLSGTDSADANHPLKLFIQPQYPSFVEIRTAPSIAGESESAVRVKTLHQLESERHSLKLILSSLITAGSTEPLKTAASELLEQVTTHMSLLFATNATPNPSTLLELDPLVLIDAITDVLSSENRDHATAAINIIDMLLDSCMKLDPEYVPPKEDTSKKAKLSASTNTAPNSKKDVEKEELNEGRASPFLLGLPVLTHLVQRLCDVCFKREWFYKVGGCMGIRHLLQRLPTAWIRHHQLSFLQAILFVLKDYPLGATPSVTDDAAHTFLKVLRASNAVGAGSLPSTESTLDEALLFLASNLTSTNSLVRKTIQTSLDKLAEWTGSEVTELLENHRKAILDPMFEHPLSRVGAKLQQAYLDAAAYCLSLRPPLIPDSPELRSFLQEAIALTDGNNDEIMRNVPLASALVDALAAAVVGWKPFQAPENMELRTKTIALFLRTLNVATSRPLIQCAKRGLEVSQDIMSRRALQEVVSPTLSSLGKLTEHMLEGLGRFLSLFPKFFTPELGKKLLDQLIPYTVVGDGIADSMIAHAVVPNPSNQPAIQSAQQQLAMQLAALPKLEPNESPLKVTAAVLELCHLLPQANKLLERVVDITMKLEARSALWTNPNERRRLSPKELTSPFRAPLAKYLNRLPQEAIAYFFSKLHDVEHATLFSNCLKSEHATALREELSRNSAKLIESAFPSSLAMHTTPHGQDETPFNRQYSFVLIVKTMLKFYPDWLSQQREILTRLHALWNAPERQERLKAESQLPLRYARETTFLIHCLTTYLRQNHNDGALFLDLLSALTTPYCHGLADLLEFYQKYVPEHYTLTEKRTLLERVLADFAPEPTSSTPSVNVTPRPGYPILHKQQILKSFVIRIFEYAVEKDQELLTKDLISLFLLNMFSLEQDHGGVRIYLAYELLSLLGLMLKNAPAELEEHLKDLIRFGWHFQRNEDPYTKQNANALFSAIIKDRTSIAPPRIRITVYAALMRSCQSEVRTSVREALDMLVPVLLAPSTAPDQQYIKWTRKVLYEESQQPQQLFHILYVLAKYEACFRPWRAMFYTSLATSFPKLTPHSLNSPVDQRKLAITIIDLLLTWERLRIKNAETPKTEESSQGALTSSATGAAMDVSAPSTESSAPQATAVAVVPPPQSTTPAPGGSEENKAASGDAVGSPATLDYGDGKLPPAHIDHIVSTLMTASLLSDPASRGITPPNQPYTSSSPPMDLSFVFMKLVKDALEVWPQANIKLSFIFMRVLDKAENPTAPHSRALLLLDTIFRVLPAHIPKHAAELTNSLPPLVQAESGETNRALCQLLSLLISKYPIGSSNNPLEALYTAVIAAVDKLMQNEKLLVDNALNVLKVVLKKPAAVAETAASSSSSEMMVTDAPAAVEAQDSSSSGPSAVAAVAEQASSAPGTEEVAVKQENSNNAMDVDGPSTEARASPAPTSASDPNTANISAATSSAMSVDAPAASASPSQGEAAAAASVVKPAEPEVVPPPKEIDILGPLLTPLLKMAIRLRDSVLVKPDTQSQDPHAAAKKPDSTPLLTIFKLLAPRLGTMMGELRRHFMLSIGLLFEKSGDEQFLLSLIALTETLPLDVKEANLILARMRRFDRTRTAPIGEAYFNFIFALYNKFKVSDIASLEPAFFSVFTARDSVIRSKFLNKFAARLPTGFAARFEVLLRPQTWDALPHLFWLQPGADLLLAQADQDLPATLGGATARLTQPRYATQAKSGSSSTASSKATPSILDSEKTLIESLKQTTVGDLIRPLSDLIYQDPDLASTIWSSLFQGAIKPVTASSAKPDPAQVQLKRLAWQHIQTALTPDDGTRGQRLQVGVAQALLKAAHSCGLHLPPKLVKYVGSTYHAWHLAVHILEERITAGFAGRSPDAPPGVVVQFPNHPTILYQSLGDLYTRLYEDDYLTSLLVNQSVMDDTKSGLVLMQQGAFSRAQEVFYQGMHDASKGMIENVPEQEQTLWETQWIECAKRLNQWDVVSSYAKSVGSVELVAESAWKLGDWDSLKEALGKFPTTDSAKNAALQAYSQLSDKNAEVDTSLAMNLVLSQWVSLPRLPCPAYTPLLVTLQRFIDIHDSIKIVKDLKQQDFLTKIHDIKTVHFRMWRERLPHECDDMTHWHDVLQWRQHMFSMLTSALTQIQTQQNPPPPVLGLGHHEAAWAINKMAHIARKQGLVDICFTSLPKIYELPNIEVQDAFTKVCEHIKCYFRLPLPASRGILDILNTTNLNYFSVIQKAEFYHLRAEYHARTGAYEDAAKAYSTAVLLYPSLPKVWTGWGRFYDERFEALLSTAALTMSEAAIAPPAIFDAGSNVITGAASSGSDSAMDLSGSNGALVASGAATPAASATPGPGASSSSSTTQSPSRLTAAHYALSCYLLALKANPQVSSRKMLVRVLWLLGFDDELCGEEASVAAAIGAAAANSASGLSHAPSLQASTILNASSMAVDSPSAENSKKREAQSPVATEDDPHTMKKRKLAENESSDEPHHLEDGAASASAGGSKMDVDSSTGAAGGASLSSSTSGAGALSSSSAAAGGDKASAFLVPPTPNTPATPSAYMIAATPATPAVIASTPGGTAASVATPAPPSGSAAVNASSSTATATPDPVMAEIGRVRKMRLLCTTFCEHTENLPAWIWLVWLPQLLAGLDRPEALAMHNVLKKVSAYYPHAIFSPLRSWILERRAKFAKVGADPVTTIHNLTTERMALALAEDLMSALRDKSPAMCADLERMSSELEQVATLTLPEALLESLTTVTRTTYDVLQEGEGIPMSTEERRAKLSLQLQLVHQHLFLGPASAAAAASASNSESSNAPEPINAPSTRPRRSTRRQEPESVSTSSTPAPSAAGSHAAAAFGISFEDQTGKWQAYSAESMRAKLQPKFEEDFGAWLAFGAGNMSPSGSAMDLDDAESGGAGASSDSIVNANASSGDLLFGSSSSKRPSIRSTLVKLKSWVRDLDRLVAALPTWLELRKSSWLAQVQSDHVLEMPAIYFDDKEMSPDTCVLIDKFESPIRVSKSSGLPRRIVTIRGSNGQFYYWYVQSSTMLPVSLAHISSLSELKSLASMSEGPHHNNIKSSNINGHHHSSSSTANGHASPSAGGGASASSATGDSSSSRSAASAHSTSGAEQDLDAKSAAGPTTRSSRSTRSRRSSDNSKSGGRGSASSGDASGGSANGSSSNKRGSSASSRSRGGREDYDSKKETSAVESSPSPFLSLTAMPHSLLWQREMRFAQLLRVTNRMWQKETHVRKRAAPLNAPALVSLTPSLRLISVEKDSVSLDDAMVEWHSKNASNSVDVLSLFDSLVGGKKSELTTMLLDGTSAFNGSRTRHGFSAEAEFAIASKERLSMYEAARCSTSDSALMDMIYGCVSDNFEGVWHVRKVLVANLAQLSLLQYLFSATLSVSPEHLLIAPATGFLQCFDLAPQMNAQGDLAPTPAVPFRLSPNLLRFTGPAIKASLFDATLTASTIVLSKTNPRSLLSHHLNLLMRDDLLDLLRHALATTQHSELNVANPTAAVSAQLKRNIKLILDRLEKVAPPSLAVYRPNTTISINNQLEKLIESAMDPLAASKMPVSWSPWI